MSKSLTTPLVVFVWVATATVPAAAREPIEALESQVRQLSLEVKTLKLELYRVSLQQISMEATPLQSELQWVQARLTRLEADDQAARERLTAVHQQWTEDRLSPEERREVERLENGRNTAETTRLIAEREKLQRREGEIGQQIQSRVQSWNAISAALAALEAEIRTMNRAPSPAPR